MAHRALVRAKVACLSVAGNVDEDSLRHWHDATQYLHLALDALVTVSPVLIAMTGLSGTGKSTVAHALGEALGAPVLSSDVTRKRLAGVEGDAGAPWQEGIYSAEWTERTYTQLLDDAELELRSHQAVIVDASFLAERWRTALAERALRNRVPAVFVEVTCDPTVVVRRIRARAASGQSVSDATGEIHRAQAQAMAVSPPGIPDGTRLVSVDTSSDAPPRIGPVLEMLRSLGAISAEIEVNDGQGR
jgi:predicted kinase